MTLEMALLADIRKYVFENYGQEPIEKQEEWKKNFLYYPVKDGEVSIGFYFKDGKYPHITFNYEKKDYSGFMCGCDNIEELDKYLNKYLPKKNAQTSLF